MRPPRRLERLPPSGGRRGVAPLAARGRGQREAHGRGRKKCPGCAASGESHRALAWAQEAPAEPPQPTNPVEGRLHASCVAPGSRRAARVRTQSVPSPWPPSSPVRRPCARPRSQRAPGGWPRAPPRAPPWWTRSRRPWPRRARGAAAPRRPPAAGAQAVWRGAARRPTAPRSGRAAPASSRGAASGGKGRGAVRRGLQSGAVRVSALHTSGNAT